MNNAKDAKILLRVLQAHGEFKNVPVTWAPSKRGPRLRITRQDVRVRVEINYKGLSVPELEKLVRRALRHANDMYREVTSASMISEGVEVREGKEGVKWSETERGMREALRAGLLERIDERMTG